MASLGNCGGGPVGLPKNIAGMVTTLEFAWRFSSWAEKQRELTPAKIMASLGVSRATAYRYLAAWKVAQARMAA